MGEQIKTQAIVLNKVDFKDNDRVLTLFSAQKGKLTASCKGVKKQNSKLRASSEVFALGTYILAESKGRYTVTGYDSIDSFFELRDDFDRLTLGVLFLKICEKSIAPDEQNIELFSLLVNSLHKLREPSVHPGFVASVFLFKYASIMGYQPELEICTKCFNNKDLIFFSAQTGGVLCKNCNDAQHLAITGGCLLYIKKICSNNFEDVFLYNPTNKQIKELYKVACYYTAYFFDEKLKIMEYINKYQIV
ncbi:MAG: DNA repair protein RecO [Clostridiales bacterium]|nr:DNA repair protein RecO [Clostridiales bacterium]